MRGIDARAHVAVMADLHTRSDRSVRCNPCLAMRGYSPTAIRSRLPVPLVAIGPLPDPAWCFVAPVFGDPEWARRSVLVPTHVATGRSDGESATAAQAGTTMLGTHGDGSPWVMAPAKAIARGRFRSLHSTCSRCVP
jgi:hypothetical protein